MPPAKQPLSIESILEQQRLEKEQQSKVRSSPRCATRSSHSPNPCTRTAKVPLKAREAGPRAPETRARSRSRKGTRTRGETQTRPTRTHSPRFALCRRRRRRRRRRRCVALGRRWRLLRRWLRRRRIDFHRLGDLVLLGFLLLLDAVNVHRSLLLSGTPRTAYVRRLIDERRLARDVGRSRSCGRTAVVPVVLRGTSAAAAGRPAVVSPVWTVSPSSITSIAVSVIGSPSCASSRPTGSVGRRTRR